MKIGVDAKWFYNGPVSGRVFIRQVLSRLLTTYPQHEWHIYLNKKNRNESFPFTGENITRHYIWSAYNMLSNRFLIPRHAKAHGLDVVLFQSFCGHQTTFRQALFVHDILFESRPEFFSWKEKTYFSFIKSSCRQADHIITSSQAVKDDLIHFKYTDNENKIDIAPLGVSENFKTLFGHDPRKISEVRSRYKLPQRFILFLGRMNTRKNIAAVLEALPLIRDKEISLVIAGEKDWEQPKLSKLIRAAGTSRVVLAGAIAEEDVPAVYAMAELFCFPSFAEGFGLPPLEAMASGLPVIVSNTSSLPEVCGDAALYVDPHHPQEIAAAVDDLLKNDFLRRQKTDAGIKRASLFTWERTAGSIMKTLGSLNKK
jgi:glycosyltransferase involved in cell wall biosynthesis